MKKKIFIGIGIFVGIILILIGVLVGKDLKQESNLKKELNEISEMVSDPDGDFKEISRRLNTTVTTGDYQKIEKAAKKYFTDILDDLIDLVTVLNDERITNILTVDNYVNDGKEFLTTRKYIKDTKEKLITGRDSYYELFTEEKVMTYLDGLTIDDYYRDFYRNEIIGDIENEKNDKTVEKAINQIIDMLDDSEKIINFLVENKNAWKVEGDTIVFDTNELVDQYNNLLLEADFIDGKDLTFSK